MNIHPQLEILGDNRYEHAEGPIWHQGRNSVFWVDILANQICEYNWNDQSITAYPNAPLISAIFEINQQNEEILVVVQGGLAIYNLRNKQVEIIDDLGIDWQEKRGNDGGIAPNGEVWFSTTHLDHLEGEGDLYSLNSSAVVNKIKDHVSISNGPCWTIDGKVMFHTDSGTRLIQSYTQYENVLVPASSQIQVPAELGYPDGMAMDKKNNLWVAIWGGFCVVAFDTETGLEVDRIELPVQHVSSCAFVGPNLDHLVITSSRKDMSAEELSKYPDSGAVFLIAMDNTGVQLNTFNKDF